MNERTRGLEAVGESDLVITSETALHVLCDRYREKLLSEGEKVPRVGTLKSAYIYWPEGCEFSVPVSVGRLMHASVRCGSFSARDCRSFRSMSNPAYDFVERTLRHYGLIGDGGRVVASWIDEGADRKSEGLFNVDGDSFLLHRYAHDLFYAYHLFKDESGVDSGFSPSLERKAMDALCVDGVCTVRDFVAKVMTPGFAGVNWDFLEDMYGHSRGKEKAREYFSRVLQYYGVVDEYWDLKVEV